MTASTSEADLVIPGRFCGPSSSGNGGYTAGSLAERLVGAAEEQTTVEVTLRQPPPLDVPMQVQQLAADDPTNVTGAPLTVLLMGGARIAEARTADADIEPVLAVPRSDAADAMTRFPGLVSHPFPTCFSCGPDRSPGDGLRIFPGPVSGGRLAALWVPDEALAESSDVLNQGQQRVGLPTAWAALDCIGGWSGDMDEGRKMVLGRMTAQFDALPVVGEPHVVVGMLRGAEGRKAYTASTMYDSDDRIVGRAEHVWLAIDPAAFG